MWNILRKEEYHLFKESNNHDDESTSFISSSSTIIPPKFDDRISWAVVTPCITTLIFASLSVFLWLNNGLSTSKTIQTLQPTEFSPSLSEIEFTKVKFTGGPALNSDGDIYVSNPGKVPYVGAPSPEIDRNWENLFWGRYFIITEQEARDAWENEFGDISQFYDPKRKAYVAGLDVFHTLHCLNNLRLKLDPDLAPENVLHGSRIHHDHCIDQIRQQLMCTADLTPIPTRWYPKRNRTYVDSDVMYTCRNFPKIRSWMSDRINGSLAVQHGF